MKRCRSDCLITDPDYADSGPDLQEEIEKDKEYFDRRLEEFEKTNVKGPMAAVAWGKKSQEEKIRYMLYEKYTTPL